MNNKESELEKTATLGSLIAINAEFCPILGDKDYLAFVNNSGEPRAYHRVAGTDQYQLCKNIKTKADLNTIIS